MRRAWLVSSGPYRGNTCEIDKIVGVSLKSVSGIRNKCRDVLEVSCVIWLPKRTSAPPAIVGAIESFKAMGSSFARGCCFLFDFIFTECLRWNRTGTYSHLFLECVLLFVTQLSPYLLSLVTLYNITSQYNPFSITIHSSIYFQLALQLHSELRRVLLKTGNLVAHPSMDPNRPELRFKS